MRVAFITEDVAPWEGDMLFGGCAYYRQILPRMALPDRPPVGKPAWTGATGFGINLLDGTAAFGFDVIVMKMIMARWTPHQMQVAQSLGQKIIVDVDDSYDDLHPANNAYHTTDPERNPIHNRDNHNKVIELADMVTVSTPYLYRHYEKRGIKNLRMVRNGVNPAQFKPKPVTARKPVIGWVGATKWRSNDVETARAWLPEFLEEHDLQFMHAGYMVDAPSFAEAAGVPPERLLVTSMLPLPMYHNLLRTMDIGLVLLSDIPFNHAKSGIKGLEYALAGVPFVAQGLPEYRRLARNGIGRVADTPEDWKQHLTSLLDPMVRRREAEANRNMTLAEHCIDSRLPEWRAVYDEFTDARLPVSTQILPYQE